jgi:ribonuclease T1
MRNVLRRVLPICAYALSATLLLAPAAAWPRAATEAPPPIASSELPQDARDVLVQIRAGGPFRYERDGITFGNREHLLPSKAHGYYHEYTVRTPGESDRGARRIICGGPRTTPDVCYYTGDHYRSFQRIVP